MIKVRVVEILNEEEANRLGYEPELFVVMVETTQVTLKDLHAVSIHHIQLAKDSWWILTNH